MPGTLERSGDVQACQSSALVPWRAVRPDGTSAGEGTNLVELDPDGSIARVVGFWK